MPIWSAEIKELQKLYETFKGQLPELEKELGKLLRADDENMILLYSRRCLEVIITDLCECELKRPRKTEPLKGIIDKLNKEGKVPSNIITSMDHVNSLSAYGAHPKDFDPEQVKPVLVNLDIIIKWYLKYKESKINITGKSEEVKDEALASDATAEKIQKPRKKLILLLSGIALVVAIVVLALFVLDVIGGGNKLKELDKSIAVLPLDYLSKNPDNEYLANGVLDAITGNLSMIEGLRVMPRTSVEQYRENKKSAKEIGEELDVSYLIEGSFQMIDDQVKLIIQLVVAKEGDHIFFKEYDREYKDIFDVQSEVAKTIAREIEVAITPEIIQRIEKKPTYSMDAYHFYQRGEDKYVSYVIERDTVALNEAERLFNNALEYDSAFALAYVGLANVYWAKHLWKEYFQINFLDSALTLTDIALSYDDELDEAYIFKGDYFREKGNKLKALNEYNKAGSINPNNWKVYSGIGELYGLDDPVKYLENKHKAATLVYGTELPIILRNIANMYHWVGLNELAYKYIQKAFHLDGDSASYYSMSGWIEYTTGDVEKAINYYKRAITLDSSRVDIYARIAGCYMGTEKFDESLKYYKIWVDKLNASGTLLINEMQRVAYAYWINGYTSEADYYFDIQMEYCNNLINTGRPFAQSFYTYYDRAGIYAFRGDKKKAYDDLKIFTQSQGYWLHAAIAVDPLFESIRNEAEFQQIVHIMEDKYQAEHEKVRKWLEENNML